MRSLMRTMTFAIALGLAPLSAGPAFAQTTPAQSRGLPDFTDLVDKVGPAVVSIRTTETVAPDASAAAPDADDGEQQCDRFGNCKPKRDERAPQTPRRGERKKPVPAPVPKPDRDRGEETPIGSASGFILSADGYVVTNAHVVQGADDIYVVLADKRELKGKLVGTDQRSDVAIIKVEASGLPVVTIGDSTRLRPGEWAVAIGAPFELESTVTHGIISAIGRDTGEFVRLIQTDVPINPGNSGGPLINLKGEVIGINSMIYSRSGGYQGISFAIPIDEAIRVVEQLKSGGKVPRGFLGVQPGTVSKEVAEALGLPRAAGAIVEKLVPNTVAEKAGLKVGDVILKVDGKTLEKNTDLLRIVGNARPGQQVTMEVWHNGTVRTLKLVLGDRETQLALAEKDAGSKPEAEDRNKSNALGLVVIALTDAQRRENRIEGGVMIESAEGPAARLGLRQGDLVLKLQNADVTSPKQFNDLVAKLDPRKTAVILVRRNDTTKYLPIRPERP